MRGRKIGYDPKMYWPFRDLLLLASTSGVGFDCSIKYLS